MPKPLNAETGVPQMEDVVSVVVDLAGEVALVDVVRPPRDARGVIESLQSRYPDRPLMAFFGLDILYDESRMVEGED